MLKSWEPCRAAGVGEWGGGVVGMGVGVADAKVELCR